MKNISPFIIVFFLITLVQSCQKDFVNTDTPAVPLVIMPHDSVTLLSKVISIDPRTSDTAWIDEIIYDSLQRVMYDKGYDYWSGNAELTNTDTYYYNAAETLPFKMISEEVGNPYIDTNYYFYDNLQRLIKKSLNSARGTKYFYTDSTIVSVGYDNFLPSNTPIVDTGFIGNTGDIIKTASNVKFVGLENSVTNYFVYDDHPNPFSLLNIYPALDPIPDEIYGPEGGYRQKNNVISSTTKDLVTPGVVNIFTYTYSYNTAGFPATVKTSNVDESFQDEIIFVYRKI